MARLYLDEHMRNFVPLLRDAGHDVLFAVDHGGQRRTDAWHFREALIDQRIVATFDRGDFEYLHRLWTTLQTLGIVATGHAGILAAARVVTPAEWLPALQERLESPEVLAGRMFAWHPDSGKWYEDAWRPEE